MLVDQIFDIKLEKNSEEVHVGKIIEVGSRAKMSKRVAELASAAADLSISEHDVDTRLRRKSTPQERAEKDDCGKEGEPSSGNATDVIAENIAEVEMDQSDIAVEEDLNTLRAQLQVQENSIENLRSKLRARDRKIAELQQKLSGFETEAEKTTVEIGDGLTVSAELVHDLKLSYKHNPGMFLRKLMEKSNLFTLEEIAESSLTGQKHRDGIQRPRLNLRKFNACKEFTIKKCKLTDDSIRMMNFKKSMINICTDARKRIKKQINQN